MMYTIKFRDSVIKCVTPSIKIDSKYSCSMEGISEITIDHYLKEFNIKIMKGNRKATPNQIEKELYKANQDDYKDIVNLLLYWTHFSKRNGKGL